MKYRSNYVVALGGSPARWWVVDDVFAARNGCEFVVSHDSHLTLRAALRRYACRMWVYD